MTTNIKLTNTQREVLEHADPHEGRITWFPDHVKGGARKKVIDGLLSRELITLNGTDYFVALGGYDALGRARPMPPTIHPDPVVEAAVSAAEANWTQEKQESAKLVPHTRRSSKLDNVITLLRRPEGATIAEVMLVTSWQNHTIRGCFAGSIKKKLGLNLISEKIGGNDRVYRIS